MTRSKTDAHPRSAVALIVAVLLGLAVPAPPVHSPDEPGGAVLAATGSLVGGSQSYTVDAGDELGAGGLLDSTVGQLLAEDLGCTATMVNSSTGRLAVTAAHCVYVPARREHLGAVYAALAPGWLAGMVFIPGRTGDQAPYGSWDVDYARIDRRWRDHGDLAFDVAFIELADRDGRPAQQDLGGQGIAFTGNAPPSVTVFGYPAAPPFDGTGRESCAGTTNAPTPGIVALDCRMTAGSSGGPWITGLDRAGAGTVAAVTSFTPLNQPDRLAGAVLGPAAQQLWQAATHQPPELRAAPTAAAKLPIDHEPPSDSRRKRAQRERPRGLTARRLSAGRAGCPLKTHWLSDGP